MISIPRTVRVFACPRPIDLRKGYDGLYGIVKQGLRERQIHLPTEW